MASLRAFSVLIRKNVLAKNVGLHAEVHRANVMHFILLEQNLVNPLIENLSLLKPGLIAMVDFHDLLLIVCNVGPYEIKESEQKKGLIDVQPVQKILIVS